MTRTSSFRTSLALLGMLFLMGLAVLMLLGPALETSTTTYRAQSSARAAPQVAIPNDLAIRGHAAKHGSEANQIYALLLEGKCVAVGKFCGGSDIEKLYTCVDPVTGVVGAILQFGDEITTGYFERDGSGYWDRRVEKENWEVCQ